MSNTPELVAPSGTPIPETRPRFEPIRVHARGGLGEVLIANDGQLHRAVALKRMLRERADDPQARERFVVEAKITGRLEHPGIVPIYGLGHDPRTGQPYYAMRLITGRNLQSALEDFHRRGANFQSLEFRKLVQCLVSVCQTVGYAHSRAVIHRDLKPANIMVGEFGETLVVDWGLAKELNRAGGPSSPATALPVAPTVEPTVPQATLAEDSSVNIPPQGGARRGCVVAWPPPKWGRLWAPPGT